MKGAGWFRVVWVSLFAAVLSVSGLRASGWAYFRFKPGQTLRYEVKSERGLSGWAKIAVAAGKQGSLDITISGDWLGEYEETATLSPDMSVMDFIYSFEDFQVVNAVVTLLNVDEAIAEKSVFQEGFSWSEGDKSIVIGGKGSFAGVDGWMVTFRSKNAMSGKMTESTYCINEGMPLPINATCPAANDVWTYTLVETGGF